MYNAIYGMSGFAAGISAGMMALLVIIAIWDLVWKGIGLWKSGTQRQLAWFICILIFNTVGILPIVYLLWFQKKDSKKRKR